MTAAPEPLFLDAPGRRLFALYHPAGADARGSVLMLPPFAEEMNMSRRMSYLAGRAIAAAGFDFLNLDLTGTGDSSGDFADARWDTWQDDMRIAADWLAAKSGHRPARLGLRAGALLAASMEPDAPLILWQPVGNGETMLNQFLRIRVAAGLTGGGEKETTRDLRAEWAKGGTVEVAGYTIAPELAAGIDGLRLADMAPPAAIRTIWIETGSAEKGPGPASQRIVDRWKDDGVRLDHHLCPGEPFWSIQETTIAPAMIDRTVAALDGL